MKSSRWMKRQDLEKKRRRKKMKRDRIFVPDHGRPSISGPIRSIKMYSQAHCTVQERLVCSRNAPCVAQEEQGFGPFHLEHLPPSPSTWGSGDSVYW
jgi:hypothetical protein